MIKESKDNIKCWEECGTIPTICLWEGKHCKTDNKCLKLSLCMPYDPAISHSAVRHDPEFQCSQQDHS